MKLKGAIRNKGLECACHIGAFVCKDTETRGTGRVRPDDSAREQSGGEGPGDKLRAKGRQRRHTDKGEEGQKREKN